MKIRYIDQTKIYKPRVFSDQHSKNAIFRTKTTIAIVLPDTTGFSEQMIFTVIFYEKYLHIKNSCYLCSVQDQKNET